VAGFAAREDYETISGVTTCFLIRRMLAILVIVGLAVSPLYAATMNGIVQPAHGSSMAGMADDMPCHPDKSSSSDKICPFMAACLSLCFQAMPPAVGALAQPAAIGVRTAFQRARHLASLAPAPPARPPRA
jgi:hypothetical protein